MFISVGCDQRETNVCVFVQPPGKRVTGLSVQAKLEVYLWLGTCSDSSHMLDGLPEGFIPSTKGADGSNPPTHLQCPGNKDAHHYGRPLVFGCSCFQIIFCYVIQILHHTTKLLPK